jgi:hypothetical protein
MTRANALSYKPMDRLWEHIEHLAPGIVLAILVTAGVLPYISPAVLSDVPQDAVLIGGAFVALGYLLGVINSSVARLLFTEIIPLMDWLRWRRLLGIVRNNAALGSAIADIRWSRDFDAVETFVNQGGQFPWSHNARWRRKRAVFATVSGRAQTHGGPLAEEMAQRRREARLMRAAVFPIWAAGIYIVSKDPSDVSAVVTIGLVILTIIAYYYRELSIVDTLEAYAEVIYEKKLSHKDS